MDFLRRHWVPVALAICAALLALLPVLTARIVLGSDWHGVPTGYGDEGLYYNEIHEVLDGHFWYGNPYFIEHAGSPPLVIFGGNWLATIPMWLGVPFVPALALNFVIWSVIFVLLGYWLLRELLLPKIWSAAGSLLSYLTSYGLVFRPSSRQQVYPFFILFYIALVRMLKHPQKRSSILLLGGVTGASFYVFSYLWQLAFITLGLLFLYACILRHWQLLRSTFFAALFGGFLGLPSLLYMLYLDRHYSYFLESIARFGLVHSHIPMAEVIYSGGWIGLLIALIAFVNWRLPHLREDSLFQIAGVFALLSGFGLWIMEGSNLFTGELLETGEHIRPFIGSWIPLAGISVAWALWRSGAIRGWNRLVVLATFVALLYATSIFVATYFYIFVDVRPLEADWHIEQGFAAPLQWIDAQQSQPVVIWTDPNDPMDVYIPALTRDYVLYSQGAIFTLTSNSELHERYLVANYFNDPTVASLKTDLPNYVGRQDAYHISKTIERGIKICEILHFWSASARAACGVAPTSIQLLGKPFFANLQQEFTNDIKPNIKTYLVKYHISYVIVDTVLEPQMHPEQLGAIQVWHDTRYEVYRFVGTQ